MGIVEAFAMLVFCITFPTITLKRFVEINSPEFEKRVRVIADQAIAEERKKRNLSLRKAVRPITQKWDAQLRGKTKLTKFEKIKKRMVDLTL